MLTVTADDVLRFDREKYATEIHVYRETEIVYRYYKDLVYVAKPVECINAPTFFALGRL